MRTLFLWLTLATLAFADNGPWSAELVKVDPADPVMATLGKWQHAASESYRKGGHTLAQFGPWMEIPSPSLRQLFPELRFITIYWDEAPAPGNDASRDIALRASRAFGLFIILAVDQGKGTTQEFSGYGNYEEFGTLLAEQRIQIDSPAQATLVWNAFCDLHQKHWKNQTQHERIDEHTWHLSVNTIDRFKYYYQVELDAKHTVVRAKLIADKVSAK